MELSDYLDQHKITRKKAAADIGLHRCHLDSIIGKSRVVSYDVAKRIEQYTQGSVTVDEMMARRKEYRCPCCDHRISRERYENISGLKEKSLEQMLEEERG